MAGRQLEPDQPPVATRTSCRAVAKLAMCVTAALAGTRGAGVEAWPEAPASATSVCGAADALSRPRADGRGGASAASARLGACACAGRATASRRGCAEVDGDGVPSVPPPAASNEPPPSPGVGSGLRRGQGTP